MKALMILLSVISLAYGKTLVAHPNSRFGTRLCVNLWDEGCINGQINGSGGDDYYLNGGGFNPGKRCINMWDEGCVNGQINGAGGDDYYLNGGGFNPGKRCINMWDEGCVNGQLSGAGEDDYYLGGNFNPGKRSLQEYFMKLHKSHPNKM